MQEEIQSYLILHSPILLSAPAASSPDAFYASCLFQLVGILVSLSRYWPIHIVQLLNISSCQEGACLRVCVQHVKSKKAKPVKRADVCYFGFVTVYLTSWEGMCVEALNCAKSQIKMSRRMGGASCCMTNSQLVLIGSKLRSPNLDSVQCNGRDQRLGEKNFVNQFADCLSLPPKSESGCNIFSTALFSVSGFRIHTHLILHFNSQFIFHKH